MAAKNLIGMGLLILLLLPAFVAEGERRRLHDGFHIALALAGIGYAWVSGGAHAALGAAATGLVCALFLASVVALTQNRWRIRPLTGGHIKLIAAGAVWLGPFAAAATLLVSGVALLSSTLVARARAERTAAPAIAPIAAVSLLVMFAVTNVA